MTTSDDTTEQAAENVRRILVEAGVDFRAVNAIPIITTAIRTAVDSERVRGKALAEAVREAGSPHIRETGCTLHGGCMRCCMAAALAAYKETPHDSA
jgi:hypothetical protein